jgi:hypothetical protein
LDISRIVAELKQERERISRAIEALEGSASTLGEKRLSDTAHNGAASEGIKRRGMTPEHRRRLSLALKRRWAERQKKGS